MTIETTKPPPKEKPWLKCSVKGCHKKWQAYHGKIGCKCHECDDKTPQYIKEKHDLRCKRVQQERTGKRRDLTKTT